MSISRRDALSLVAFAAVAASCKPVRAADPITPEQFGARGDGRSADGPALAAMIDHVNSLGGDARVYVQCQGDYSLAGAPRRPVAPSHKGKSGGATFGLPAITRNNVTIDAQGARFRVPDEFDFVRIKRGGSDDDRFFVMWQFLGDNIEFTGGLVDGNLGGRRVERGPRPMGFGGQDFGFVLEGANWLLYGVDVRAFGTDDILVTNWGRASNCRISYARRNGLSVVAAQPIAPQNPVVIENCEFSHNGDWPNDIYNNPAAGMVVEAGGSAQSATVIIRDNDFSNNKLKDLQLSKASVDCVVTGNTFSHDLNLRPLQMGGHVIEDNDFMGDARIKITSTDPDAKPVRIRSNRQNGSPVDDRFVRHSRSRVEGAGFEQDVLD